MKLARIEHSRCGEMLDWRRGSGYTYLWVPDEWTEEILQEFVGKARESYLKAEREFKQLTPAPSPGYGAAILPSTPDSMTVGELKAEYEARAKVSRAYQEMVSRSRKPFLFHLKEVAGGSVAEFWERKADVEAECDWGHNHGLTIDHSGTELKDYPFPSDDGDEL